MIGTAAEICSCISIQGVKWENKIATRRSSSTRHITCHPSTRNKFQKKRDSTVLSSGRLAARRFSHARIWALVLILLAPFDLALSAPRRSEVKTTRNKISPDLAQKIARSQSSHRAKVIVQFNQHPTRELDLMLTHLGGRVTRKLNNFKIHVLDLPLGAVEALAARTDVRFISPDRPARAYGHVEATTGTGIVRTQTTTTSDGLNTTTVSDGNGISIAIVDSGIDTHHTAFKNEFGVSRVTASEDFTGESRTDDPYGHGTHVASIAAGNDQIASGAYTGIAPAANLINLRILDSQGAGTTSSLLAALDWVLTFRTLHNIRVINLSVGTSAIDSYLNDPICQAVRRVTDAGVVVVAAAGNNGRGINGEKIYGQIHAPGNEPSAITVGAANTFGTDVRNGDIVTTYSSRGPTRSFWTDASEVRHYDNLIKPDLVAPGNKIVGAAASNSSLLAAHPELDAEVSTLPTRRMMYLSGSSMATPIAAGTAALLLQANENLSPSLIKAIFMYTAQPLSGMNMLEQGAGQLNVNGALTLARLVRTDVSSSTALGEPLLTGDVPAQQSTISGGTFFWGRGIILNRAYATNTELITKYQQVYAPGFSLGDGVDETANDQAINPTRFTSGVMLGKDVLI